MLSSTLPAANAVIPSRTGERPDAASEVCGSAKGSAESGARIARRDSSGLDSESDRRAVGSIALLCYFCVRL